MLCRAFNCETDLSFLNSWLSARSMPIVDKEDLPEIGFLVCQGDLPIGCAFLRKVEGSFGFYDSQATNPEASSESRHAALNLLFEEMCKAAKALHLKALIAHTTDKSTLARSLLYGFKQLLGTMIVKDLA